MIEIPTFVDSTLAAFSEHQISSVSSLLKENFGVKGLKQLGLATPAAWALHSVLEKMRLSHATAPVSDTVSARMVAIEIEDKEIVVVPSPNSDQESTVKEPQESMEHPENSSNPKKIWGYAVEGGSSSESENEEAEVCEQTQQPTCVEESPAPQGGAQCSYSWRRKFVVMDSSSSDDERVSE